jgi:hypothetical protein
VKAEAMKRAIAMATRVASNQAMAMAMAMATVARVMAMAMRVLGKRQRGRWPRQQLWRATMRGIETAMRVASNKEGEGSKVMKMVTRVAGEQW